MATKWPNSPKDFDVVWCRIPYVGQQGEVRHPCLVIAVISGATDVAVMVAGGTSIAKGGQFVRQIKATDFVLQEPLVLQQAGLTNKTAFQFEPNAIATFPWDDDRFVVGPPLGGPIAGRVDFNNQRTFQALVAAGKAGDLNALIEAEKKRVQQLGSAPENC